MRCPNVTLLWHELQTAANIGVRRQIQNIRKDREYTYGASPEDAWNLHIEGAAGEMAVAKYLGRYWTGSLGDLGADDVGNVQVRTAAKHTHRLILHEKDRDDRAFVLVTGLAPKFVLRGWMWAWEGKCGDYWRDPGTGRPAYFIPQSALRPMDTLEDGIGRR